MTASPQMQALRFRIWQFAAPREWDVTIPEIAKALEEPTMRVRNAVVHAGWVSRVRTVTAYAQDGFGARNSGQRNIERFVVADILAGRVNSEFTA